MVSFYFLVGSYKIFYAYISFFVCVKKTMGGPLGF
mgnify:CR=1 FL=1